MHYFQFNIGDYASHTRHLSLMEDLAYRRMLDSYYLREAALPENAAEVARLIGMRDHIPEIEQVLADFFELTAEGWRHGRADREIAGYARFLEKQRENGKRGGRPRNNPEETHWKPTANPSQTQTEPKKSLTTNHKPLTNNQDLSSKDDCASGDALKPDHVAEKWNEIAGAIGRPRIRGLTPERRQLVRSRIAQYQIEDFVAVFGKCTESPFLRGEKGWSGATFDWVMKKSNFQKILEGNYDG